MKKVIIIAAVSVVLWGCADATRDDVVFYAEEKDVSGTMQQSRPQNDDSDSSDDNEYDDDNNGGKTAGGSDAEGSSSQSGQNAPSSGIASDGGASAETQGSSGGNGGASGSSGGSGEDGGSGGAEGGSGAGEGSAQKDIDEWWKGCYVDSAGGITIRQMPEKRSAAYTVENGKRVLTIPARIDGKEVIEVSNSAAGNEDIASFKVEDGSKHFCAVDGMVLTSDKKTLVLFPNGREVCKVPSCVEYIGNCAMCSARLESVVFENARNLKTIGRSAFNGCLMLTSIDLSRAANLVTIGKRAFSQCPKLNALDLSSATKLTGEEDAFMGLADKAVTVASSDIVLKFSSGEEYAKVSTKQ